MQFCAWLDDMPQVCSWGERDTRVVPCFTFSESIPHWEIIAAIVVGAVLATTVACSAAFLRGGAIFFEIIDLKTGRCLDLIAVYLTHVGRCYPSVGVPVFSVHSGRLFKCVAIIY